MLALRASLLRDPRFVGERLSALEAAATSLGDHSAVTAIAKACTSRGSDFEVSRWLNDFLAAINQSDNPDLHYGEIFDISHPKLSPWIAKLRQPTPLGGDQRKHLYGARDYFELRVPGLWEALESSDNIAGASA